MSIFLCGLAMMLLAGCGGFKPAALMRPPREGECVILDDVTVRIKRLQDYECVQYFDKRLVSTVDLHPIQIYVKNNSKTHYVLHGDRVTLPFLGHRAASQYLKENILGRSVIYIAGTIVVHWPVFLTLFGIDFLRCLIRNHQVTQDIESYCISAADSFTIAPGTRLHKVGFVFAEKDQPHFSVTLLEQDSGKEKVFMF